jgi:hypothetical protein
MYRNNRYYPAVTSNHNAFYAMGGGNTPDCRPRNLGVWLPITEWINGTIYYVNNVGTRRQTGVTSILGKDCSISYSDPEVTRLCNIITAMAEEDPESDEIKHVWLDPLNDPNDVDFYDKMIRMIYLSVNNNSLHSRMNTTYMPNSAQVGQKNFFMLTQMPHTDPTAFPSYAALSDWIDKAASDKTFNFFNDTRPAMAIMDGAGAQQCSNFDNITNPPGWINDGSTKGVQVHIFADDEGKVCLVRSMQYWETKDASHLQTQHHSGIAVFEWIDQYKDYGLLHSPMSVKHYVDQGLAFNTPVTSQTFTTNVRRRNSDTYGNTVASSTPFCALIGLHVDGGDPDELKVSDIVVSGHKLGWTTVAYSPGGDGVTAADIGGYPIRLDEDVMVHCDIPRANTPNFDIGVLPTLAPGWIKSTLTGTNVSKSVVLNEYNDLRPLNFTVDVTSLPNRYTIASGNNVDEGLVVTNSDAYGILDTGHLVLGGQLVSFGDVRWTRNLN